MDLTFQILLIIHLLALAAGTTAAIAMPILMFRLRNVSPDVRGAALGAASVLGVNARIALGVLIVTGGPMVWLRYGGVDGLNGWFWVKMLLVAVLAVMSIAGAVLPRGTLNPRVTTWVTRISLVGAVIAAVLAFR